MKTKSYLKYIELLINSADDNERFKIINGSGGADEAFQNGNITFDQLELLIKLANKLNNY